MRILRLCSLSVAVLGLSACLENEEEIEVFPDGAVQVTVTASGDLADLSDGFSVPLGPDWQPLGEDSRRWMRLIGPETGSAFVQKQAEAVQGIWIGQTGDDEAQLSSRRVFDRFQDWSRWYVPEGIPYRTAYLERSASLKVESHGGRQVFLFERTYHGRRYAGLNAFEHAYESLPETLQKKLADHDAITNEEWRIVSSRISKACQHAAELFVRDAVSSVFIEGDASLRPAALPEISDHVRNAVRGVLSPERLARLYEWLSSDGDGEEDPGAQLMHDLRQAIRTTLKKDLEQENITPGTRNAVLFALEWGFTAFDHTDDLGDEKFAVTLSLPGVLIDGNYGEVVQGRARWEFEGPELRDRDMVLRAVSVLE